MFLLILEHGLLIPSKVKMKQWHFVSILWRGIDKSFMKSQIAYSSGQVSII